MATFIFPLLFSLIPVAIAALIIALIAYAIKRKDKKTEISFTPHFMLKVYTYIVLLASIITFTGGISLLFNASFAYTFGDDFSFQPEYIEDYYPPEETVVDAATGETRVVMGDWKEPEYEIPEGSFTKTLIQGITMTIISLIVGAIHLILLGSVEPKKERKKSVMYRLFVTIGLGIYTIGALIALPVGIYTTISFFLIDQTGRLPYQLLVPGESLSSAIVYLPFWIMFIVLLLKLRKESK